MAFTRITAQPSFGRFGITISPLSLIPVDNHSYLKMGLDVGITDHFRVIGEYGYALPIKTYGKTTGFTVKGEFRFKLSGGALLNDFRPNLYVGLRYYYKNETVQDSIATQPSNADPYNVGFTLHKQMNAIALKFGDYHPIGDSEHWWFDYYIGFGLRVNTIHCIGMTEDEIANRDYGDSFILPVLYHCDSGKTLDVDIGFRLIYYFL
jgi:hypothetical protein